MTLDISSLKPGDTIAVRNEEELITLLGALQAAGYHWWGGQKPLEWRDYAENITAVAIKDYKKIGYWNTDAYLNIVDKSRLHWLDELIFYPPEPEIDISIYFD